MKDEVKDAITKLINQAKNSSDSFESMRFGQAATNIANAYATFVHADRVERGK